MEIVLLSHGYFARELFNSCRYINNEIDAVTCFCLTDEGIDQFGASLRSFLKESSEKEKLFFCDLAHGSPYNQLLIALIDLDISNYRIITGMNLPMLLQASIMVKLSNDLDSVTKECEKIGTDGVKVYDPTKS